MIAKIYNKSLTKLPERLKKLVKEKNSKVILISSSSGGVEQIASNIEDLNIIVINWDLYQSMSLDTSDKIWEEIEKIVEG